VIVSFVVWPVPPCLSVRRKRVSPTLFFRGASALLPLAGELARHSDVLGFHFALFSSPVCCFFLLLSILGRKIFLAVMLFPRDLLSPNIDCSLLDVLGCSRGRLCAPPLYSCHELMRPLHSKSRFFSGHSQFQSALDPLFRPFLIFSHAGLLPLPPWVTSKTNASNHALSFSPTLSDMDVFPFCLREANTPPAQKHSPPPPISFPWQGLLWLFPSCTKPKVFHWTSRKPPNLSWNFPLAIGFPPSSQLT